MVFLELMILYDFGLGLYHKTNTEFSRLLTYFYKNCFGEKIVISKIKNHEIKNKTGKYFSTVHYNFTIYDNDLTINKDYIFVGTNKNESNKLKFYNIKDLKKYITNTDIFKVQVVYAYLGNTYDLTNLVSKFAGPYGNFHKNIGTPITKEMILSEYNCPFTEKSLDNLELNIIMNDGSEFNLIDNNDAIIINENILI